MNQLTNSYRENVSYMDDLLRVGENFDLLKKTLSIGKDEITLYFIDGFIKDTVMQKLMMHFLSQKSLDFPLRDGAPHSSAQRFLNCALPSDNSWSKRDFGCDGG